MVDTMIRLFESTATTFTSNGLGNLPDASKCEVVEERNGSFELEMEYHVSGKRYSDIQLRRIVFVKPNPYDEAQPFRIYYISKPINGLITIKAEHISYDMTGYPVSPFSANDVTAVLLNLKANSIIDCPFEFSTDMSSSGEFTILKPTSMRSLLGASSDSILDKYGGEFEFNGYKIILHNNRGHNNGVSIRYGKNMTDLKQEENCSDLYTAVYPFWYSDEWGLITLPEKTVNAPGTYDFTRIYPLDLSSSWENTYEWEDEYPTEDEIRELANKYIEENNIGVPKVSLTVSFEQLSQAKEYAMISLLERVYLCDEVNVEFPKLGVSAISKCIKTTYNVLTGKYVSIELGETQSNLTSSIASTNEELSNRPTKSFMTYAVEKATRLISGGLGGYVVMRSSTGGSHPDEILIMDTPDIETATKVWRWNRGGLGYSDKGYNGPYTTAITQNGEFVADFIKTGHMTANIIRGGALTVGGIDNTNGTIEVRDKDNKLLVKISVDGLSFSNDGEKPVATIIQNTVTTEFVNSLKVIAGSVAAEDITGITIRGKTITGGQIIGTTIISQSGEYISKIMSGRIQSTLIELIPPDGGDGLVPGIVKVNEAGTTITNGFYLKDDETELTKPLYVTNGAGGSATYYPYVGILSVGRIYSDGAVCPGYDEEHSCGSSGYKWSTVYAKNGTINTSDRNKKHDIKDIPEVYEKLFFGLKPVLYMFNNGDRIHIGGIAQDLKETMNNLGLENDDLAAYCCDVRMKPIKNEDTGEVTEVPVLDENGKLIYDYGIRYSEFIMLNTHMLQKAYQRIDEQQKEIDTLNNQVKEILACMKGSDT